MSDYTKPIQTKKMMKMTQEQMTSIDQIVQEMEIPSDDTQRLQSSHSSPNFSGNALEIYKAAKEQAEAALEKLKLEDPEEYIEIEKGRTDIVDAQTGLFSKYFFQKELVPHLMKKAKEEGTTISYVIGDFDDFGKFNNQYGHAAGDAGIEYFVNKMNDNLRTKDTIQGEKPRKKDLRGARVGYGEEFAFILYGVEESQALIVAERLRQSIYNDTVKSEERELHVTASFGVAEMKPGEHACNLYKRADEALYKAKDLGKNTAMSYSQMPKESEIKSDNSKIPLKEAA